MLHAHNWVAVVALCGALVWTEAQSEEDLAPACRTVLLQQDWESCNWDTPEGTWSTDGSWRLCDDGVCSPDSAFSVSCFAASYMGDGSLFSPTYVLPDTTWGERLFLRFWHWYGLGDCGGFGGCCYGGGYKDSAFAAVRRTGDPWEDKLAFDCWNSIWHPNEVDITEYAGDAIQVSFRLEDNCGCAPRKGWFVDDITIERCRFCADAGPTLALTSGDSVRIQASVGCGTPLYYYSWSPCAGLSDCYALSPFAKPQSTTKYILTVLDSANPPDTAQDSVTVLLCSNDMNGDVNYDDQITAGDIIYLVNYVYKGGLPPRPCVAFGDANCNGTVNSADIIHLVNHVFKSGPLPCDVCTLIPGTWTCP